MTFEEWWSGSREPWLDGLPQQKISEQMELLAVLDVCRQYAEAAWIARGKAVQEGESDTGDISMTRLEFLCRKSGLPISEVERQADMGLVWIFAGEDCDGRCYSGSMLGANLQDGDYVRMGRDLVDVVIRKERRS